MNTPELNDKKHILIVEDDVSLMNLLKSILELKYNVKTMQNPIAAWDWLKEGKFPDVILTDFKMPVINGMELVINLRTSGIYKDIPIIIITGSSESSLEQMAAKWQIEGILYKPFDPEELEKTIEEIFNKTENNHV